MMAAMLVLQVTLDQTMYVFFFDSPDTVFQITKFRVNGEVVTAFGCIRRCGPICLLLGMTTSKIHPKVYMMAAMLEGNSVPSSLNFFG